MTYPVKVSIDYNDLEKDKIYDIDYRLVKNINENENKKIMNNKIYLDNENISNFNSEDENNKEN